MRKQGIGLKDGVDLSLVWRQVGNVDSAEEQATFGRLLKAADHAKSGRLAAARGTEKREELASLDVQREAIDGDGLFEDLRNLA
jgi:hypothetical protein